MTDGLPTLKHRLAKYGKNLVPVASYAVTYKDVFSLNYLYLLLHEWLVEEGYATRDDSKFPESFYLQRVKPDSGDEYWIRWRLSKKPYATMLWEYHIDIDIHVILLKKTELLLAGKKYSADKAEVEIAVNSYLVVDPKKTLDRFPTKPFKWMLIKGIMRKRFENHQKALYTESYRLQDAIKTYLKLETYLPEKELAEFWQKRPG